jgi:hypothetical protein
LTSPTPESGSVPEPVLLQANQESSDALALVAELSSIEALRTSEVNCNSAQSLAENSTTESRNLATSAASPPASLAAKLDIPNSSALQSAWDWPSESMVGNLKAAEALKTWLGRKPSSMQAVTNALCVALTEDLKLITLNQSKTFQGFNTTRQTDCASAISVTITESMAECLILFTVDTLRKQAIDKAAGAERTEVVGSKLGRPGMAKDGSNQRSGFDAAFGEGEGLAMDHNVYAPATPEAQQWDGWGTALKPALEPITVARKPFKGTVAANVLEHGTGAINIDGCRVGTEEIEQGRFGRGVADSTSYHDGLKPTEKTVAVGRWPANLIHDGSDEVTELFPQTGISRGGNSQQINAGTGRYNWNTGTDKAVPDGVDPGYGDSGSAARFFYCAKTSKRERGEGNNHPTVKPIALMRYLCRLVTPPGGTVLDPFMGSGSTGIAARAESFNFVGIELDPDYFAIAQQRIKESELLSEMLAD